MMFFGVLKSGEMTNVGEEAAAVAAKDSIPIRLYNFIAGKKKDEKERNGYNRFKYQIVISTSKKKLCRSVRSESRLQIFLNLFICTIPGIYIFLFLSLILADVNVLNK